jgi:biopolymer transport protein ExbD
MSANFGSDSSQDVELNITPIIDCFTVLITFMLASASFISIGYFEASTPSIASGSDAQEPDTEAVIKVREGNLVELKLKGKKSGTIRYNLADDSSLKSLRSEIEGLKSPAYHLNQVLLSAEDTVAYESLTRIMDQVQATGLPVVVGDFEERS